MEFPSRSQDERRPARHTPIPQKRRPDHLISTTSTPIEPTTSSHNVDSANNFSIEALPSSPTSGSTRRSPNGARSVDSSRPNQRSLKLHFFFSLVIICSFLISTGSCRAMQTCSIVGHKYIIDIAGCDLVAVAVNRCSGFCRSLSFINVIDGTHHIHAKCCKMIEVEKIPVNVTCTEGLRVLEVTSARECACFDCSSQK